MRTDWVGGFIISLTLLTRPASADPLVYLNLQGRPSGSSEPFASSVIVTPGEPVDFQVVARMAPIGTTNGARTITSLTESTALQAGDGIQSMVLDLFQLPTDPVQLDLAPVTLNTDPTSMPNDTWAGHVAATGGIPMLRPGSASLHDLWNIYAIHVAGTRTAVNPEVVFSGTFTTAVDSVPGNSSLLRLRWAVNEIGKRKTLGSIAINGHPTLSDVIFISKSSESSANPYVAIDSPLFGSSPSDGLGMAQTYQLQVTVVPEPASASLLLLGALPLMFRRAKR